MSKYVIVSDTAEVNGGAAKVAIMTAIGLAESGKEVIFFAGGGKTDEKLLSDKNIEVINLLMPDLLSGSKFKMFFKGIYNKKAKVEFAKLLDRLDLENTVIHVHSWVKVLSPSIFEALKERNKEFYITAHDYFLKCPNGGFFNYKKNKICKGKKGLSCLCTNCDSRKGIYKIWRCIKFRRQVKCLKGCKYKLFVLSELMNSVIDIDGITKQKLNNPIDLNENELDYTITPEYYAYIGRLSKEKGADIFCKAIVSAGVKGVLIGSGPEYENLKAEYSDCENLEFAGWLDRKQLLSYYPKIKWLIFPSVCYEGAPLTIPEVNSFGIPAIVSDACSGTEYITEGKNGYVFKSQDIKDLLDKIETAENMDKDDYVSIRKNTFLISQKENNNQERYISKLLELYSE